MRDQDIRFAVWDLAASKSEKNTNASTIFSGRMNNHDFSPFFLLIHIETQSSRWVGHNLRPSKFTGPQFPEVVHILGADWSSMFRSKRLTWDHMPLDFLETIQTWDWV